MNRSAALAPVLCIARTDHSMMPSRSMYQLMVSARHHGSNIIASTWSLQPLVHGTSTFRRGTSSALIVVLLAFLVAPACY